MNCKSGGLVSAFIGVNAGYQGDNVDIQDPQEAVRIVQDEASNLGFDADLYQGYAIYPTDWGCPVGGEVVAAVFTQSDNGADVQKFDELRKSLQQTSLAVVSSHDSDGELTEGFTICLGDVDLQGIALKWQGLAQQQKDAGGLYICGVAYSKDGQIYAQAEANPNKTSSNYVQDIGKWKAAVINLFANINSELQPDFRSVGFNYLRSDMT